MVKIKWTKWSFKDLRAIYNYISMDSSFYATRFIQKLISRVDQLIEQPESGRIVPEKEDTSIRELIEGNYRIIYRFQGENVTILRIHNSARKIK
ncbi:MAG: type II toxin-antitoxin system RelE/ParE family toxin [Sphingobacteriales bacterium]|nr:MAG: type II toxin-antitoxin system RelE/ParE family toxin [Sphingobacteriales bacterium]